jgi:heptosyltransferase-2
LSAERKVLVVGPAWVGDMVMAQTLYKALRDRAPHTVIDVVAPPWSLPILERMPEVRHALELDVRHGELALGKRRALGRALRAERYEEAIVLPRSAKAALVPWFAQIPRRVGFRGEWRFGLLNDVRGGYRELDQTVKRFVALGLARDERPPPALPERWRPALTIRCANFARLAAELDLPQGAPLAALMPGAEYGPAKRWPTERYAELAADLANRGAAVLVLGSAKEAALGDAIRAAAGGDRVRSLCGRTSLGDVVDVLGAVDVAVTNDSGLMHVAAAAGAYVVAIYGSSSPSFTPPLTAASEILHLGLDCSPCFARECPLGHLRCLRDIRVADVRAAVDRALAARSRAHGPAEETAHDG